MIHWSNEIVALRGLSFEYAEIIARWNFSQELSDFFPPRFPNSTPEQEAWFKKQFDIKDKKILVIESLKDKEPVGLLSFMKIDHVNKNCEVGITIGEEKYRGKDIAENALYLGLNFLFLHQNIYTVYARVLDQNIRAIKFFIKAGFQQDGVQRNMVFHNGDYRSWVLLSITKDEFLHGK